mmetsp:Transcript_18201/g.20947  ORF Transcript_18201/g.20947 Transcript_18201/m.20947 type:complete len:528 (-) Transcript_18201:1270-2853(-)
MSTQAVAPNHPPRYTTPPTVNQQQPDETASDTGNQSASSSSPHTGPTSCTSTPWYHAPDPATGVCSCPACVLAYYMNTVVYGNQKIASSDVMAEFPSPCFRGNRSANATDSPLPPSYTATTTLAAEVCSGSSSLGNNSALTGSPTADYSSLERCPMYDAFRFCIYGRTCLLLHDSSKGSPPSDDDARTCVPSQAHTTSEFPLLSQLPQDLDGALESVIRLGVTHSTTDVWTCFVCGFDNIVEGLYETKVGETASYRYCPNCTVWCYLPHMLNLIERLVDAVGDDYQLYKTMVEQFRTQVPDILKIPLSYEAHRIATTVFAWSLVSPTDAKFALDLALKYSPDARNVASLGSGTGYVEHVFNRVANGVPACPRDPSIAGRTSSFDGVRCEALVERGTPLAFFAFDEIIRPVQFSVAVNFGAPHVLQSLNCSQTILLLSWPPFGSAEEEQSSMGFEALRTYTANGGNIVIYVGDVSSTGDWRFHSLLLQEYRLVKDMPVRREVRRWYPQEMGLVYAGCDTMGVYIRRRL